MAVWPNEIYEAIAPRLGRACYGLLFTERRWVHRRVETISIFSRESARRSVSVDFSIPSQFRDQLALPGESRWLVPLARVLKGPLENFDLRDDGGHAIPLVGMDHNRLIAQHILLTAARIPLKRAGIQAPSAEFHARLRRFVDRQTGEDASEIVAEMQHAAANGSEEDRIALGDDRFRFLLLDLTESYLFMAEVDDVRNRRILKFAFDHDLERAAAPSWAERLGWRPVVIEAVTPASAGSGSYHAEIEIPDELRVSASAILDESNRAVYASGAESNRPSLHVSAIPGDAEPVLLFGIRAERAGFPIVSLTVSWILFFVLGFGALSGGLDTAVASPPISVLLAASAIFAGAVARSGEHRLVQAQFSLPRIVLVVSALAALVAACVLAFGLCAGTVEAIWKICAAIALGAAAILTVGYFAAAPTRRRS